MEGAVISNEEIDVVFQNGSRGVLRVSAAPMRSNATLGCVITGAVAIAVDITFERAQAEERLQVFDIFATFHAGAGTHIHFPFNVSYLAFVGRTSCNRRKQA